MSRASAPSLGILIGTWEFESTKDGRWMGRGSTTFEWIEDGAFVLQHADDQPSPDADPEWIAHSPMPVTSIIGFDDTTLEHAMLYADARGVFRIYRMSLSDDSWRLWRAAPGFHQRFIGALRDHGRTIEGRWESSPDGSAWEPDFDMTYRKTDEIGGSRESVQRHTNSNHRRAIMTMTEATTRTLDVPGATLIYDVRPNDSTTETPLFLIGSPMGAAGFGSLIKHFTDRTIVTYDPRGAERSTKPDMTSESTPDEHADDVHRIIQELGGGPVDLFASSGGATNALALVAKHPEDVRTLVAHEPPIATVLPDRENAQAAARAVHETYQRSGFGAGMAHFIAVVSHQGEFPDDFAQQPAPDPAMFGMPTDDDGSRTDPLMGQNILTGTHHEPDFDALRAAATRIVIAAGVESEGILPSRAAFAVAERLGTEVVIFPSGHGGFMGGEYGQPAGEPEAFAAKLRQVLTDA